MKELYSLNLLEAVEGIRAGTFTGVEYVRACLDRIAALEDHVGAWVMVDEKRALTLAEAADIRRQNKRYGPLDGIPVGIKDIIDVVGIPTRMGSPIFENYRPSQSAKVVRSIEDAGGCVLGKTVTAEFAFLAPGKTRNPWNGAHTPGGSSSGSAAAVAAGFVPAALGTQTNGSVIRPAAFCGVVGFKPSRGAIPNHGTLDYSPTLDQTGVFTRSVADAAYFVSCIAESDRPVNAQVLPWNQTPRLAAVRTPVWPLAEEAQQAVFTANILRLREEGAEVEEVELPELFNQGHKTLRTIMAYEAHTYFRDIQQRHRSSISQELNALLDEGGATAEADYRTALGLRRDLQRELAGFLSRFDGIITPPAAGEAPATLTHTGNPSFCTLWNLCGVPAITIPSGRSPRGLPLGLQIVGRFGEDDALLSLAQWCESNLPFTGLVQTNSAV